MADIRETQFKLSDESFTEIKERRSSAALAKRDDELNWQANIAYYAGYQWLLKNKLTGQVIIEDTKDWKKYYVCNMIRSAVRTALAKITASKPDIEVTPASNQEIDKNNAKIWGKWIEAALIKLGWEAQNNELSNWVLITGNAFMQIRWNDQAAPFISQNFLDDNPNSPTYQKKQTISTPLGEIQIIFRTPFELFPDSTARNMSEANHIFLVTNIARDTARAMFPKAKISKEGSSNSATDGIQIVDALSMLEETAARRQRSKHTITITEYYERSTTEFPNGRLIIYTDEISEPLWVGDNPDPDGGIPFVHFGDFYMPGKFWFTSFVHDARPVQFRYNKSRSATQENIDTMANLKWWWPLGGQLKKSQPTNEPFEIIEGIPGHEPRQIQALPLPAHMVNEPQTIIQEMMEITGQREVSKGSIPAGIRSGRAVAYLQEQDDSRLGPCIRNREQGLRLLGIKMLRYANKFYQPDTMQARRIIMRGKGRTYSEILFDPSAIRDEIDINVRIGSALPKSITARQDFARMLWQDRLISEPGKILRMMELGTDDTIMEDIELDEQQAAWENEQMKKGIDIPANNFDNIPVHVYTHNKHRKTIEYLESQPQIKQIFEKHVMKHLQDATPMPPPGPPQPGQPGSEQPPDQGMMGPVISEPVMNQKGQ